MMEKSAEIKCGSHANISQSGRKKLIYDKVEIISSKDRTCGHKCSLVTNAIGERVCPECGSVFDESGGIILTEDSYHPRKFTSALPQKKGDTTLQRNTAKISRIIRRSCNDSYRDHVVKVSKSVFRQLIKKHCLPNYYLIEDGVIEKIFNSVTPRSKFCNPNLVGILALSECLRIYCGNYGLIFKALDDAKIPIKSYFKGRESLVKKKIFKQVDFSLVEKALVNRVAEKMQLSFEIQTEAVKLVSLLVRWSDPRYSGTPECVAATIIWHTLSRYDEYSPSQATIARAAGISTSTLSRAIQRYYKSRSKIFSKKVEDQNIMMQAQDIIPEDSVA